MAGKYDAFLLVSYGGPEGPGDVMPYLENVVQGKNVPEARLKEVARKYDEFGGISPINIHNRALLVELCERFQSDQTWNPTVYWGNRYWHPMLDDALEKMHEDGITRALALATTPYESSYGRSAYIQAVQQARESVGPDAPVVDFLPPFFREPEFIEVMAEKTAAAFEELPEEDSESAKLIFAAHSIPVDGSDEYVAQLRESCRLTAEKMGRGDDWQLAFQSRSGRPSEAWLEPDIEQLATELGEDNQTEDIVVVPIGFMSDNFEVIYDLDVELRNTAEGVGLGMVRAATVGTDSRIIDMICRLATKRENLS